MDLIIISTLVHVFLGGAPVITEGQESSTEVITLQAEVQLKNNEISRQNQHIEKLVSVGEEPGYLTVHDSQGRISHCA